MIDQRLCDDRTYICILYEILIAIVDWNSARCQQMHSGTTPKLVPLLVFCTFYTKQLFVCGFLGMLDDHGNHQCTLWINMLKTCISHH